MEIKQPSPPIAKEIPTELVNHNHSRIDEYYWMKDRENPEVIQYIEAENEYCEAQQSHNKSLRKALFDEIKGRMKEDDSSYPYFSNNYWYYSRYEPGEELAIYCRKEQSLDQPEIILINENTQGKDHDYYEIVAMSVSPNNELMAFAEDLTGRRQYNIRLKNLVENTITDIPIKNTSSDIVWHSDNETIYFVQKDAETLRPFQVKSYNLRTGVERVHFTEKDEKFSCGIAKSKDDLYIIIGSYSTLSTEFHFKSSNDSSKFTCFLKRSEKHEYYLDIIGDQCYLKTNHNAPNFALATCALNKRELDDWYFFQKGSEQIYIEDFDVFKNHICVLEKEAGLGRIAFFSRNNYTKTIVPVNEETYALYFGINEEVDLPYLRIGYTSMTQPSSVYAIDLNTLEWNLLKQQPVLGNFDSANYKSERKWIKARDGVEVPVSIVYRKDSFQKNSQNPILIYAYGSYGSAIDPYFSSSRISLLDRGFVYAIAHIRGGDDLGQDWYESGKLLKKMNTFHDFIDVAEGLILDKYCNPSKVFAMGGSAGGLLMGVIANLRPELWAGIVSQVPFVDVVTTMLDETIPLTTGEYDEWGNPNVKEYYEFMLTYSPYDQLSAKAYPPLLVISGLHDSQVQYWEPTKYVARLRKLKTNDQPLLLRTNMDAGHGGSAGRYEEIKEIAYNFAFLIDLASK